LQDLLGETGRTLVGTHPVTLHTCCRLTRISGHPSLSFGMAKLGFERVLVLLVAAGFLAVHARQASACSLAGAKPLTVDPQAQATDGTPPSTPVAKVDSIKRGKGPTGTSTCGMSASSCDDLGTIAIAVSATDDQTTSDQLGYRVELASGSLPGDLALPTTPILAMGGYLYFHWLDGATDEQEDVSLSLAITTVDRAGNASPSSTVGIHSPGSGGCSLLGRRLGSSWAASTVLVLVGARLLRRRTRPA
jgi:hypothetical protein